MWMDISVSFHIFFIFPICVSICSIYFPFQWLSPWIRPRSSRWRLSLCSPRNCQRWLTAWGWQLWMAINWGKHRKTCGKAMGKPRKSMEIYLLSCCFCSTSRVKKDGRIARKKRGRSPNVSMTPSWFGSRQEDRQGLWLVQDQGAQCSRWWRWMQMANGEGIRPVFLL